MDLNGDSHDKHTSLPPGLQGDTIGILRLRIPTCIITKIDENIPFDSIPKLSKSSTINDVNDININGGDPNRIVASNAITFDLRFWGENSWTSITPIELNCDDGSIIPYTTSAYVDSMKKEEELNQKQKEYLLVGSWKGLQRYFSDMGSLPLKVISLSENEQNVIGVSKLHLQLPNSLLFQSYSDNHINPSLPSNINSSQCDDTYVSDGLFSYYSQCQDVKIGAVNNDNLSLLTPFVTGQATIEITFYVRDSILATLNSTSILATLTDLEKKQKKEEKQISGESKISIKKEILNGGSNSGDNSPYHIISVNGCEEKPSCVNKPNNKNIGKEGNLLDDIFQKVDFLKQELNYGVEGEDLDYRSPTKSFLFEEDNNDVLNLDKVEGIISQEHHKTDFYQDYSKTFDEFCTPNSQIDSFPTFQNKSLSQRITKNRYNVEELSTLLIDIEKSKSPASKITDNNLNNIFSTNTKKTPQSNNKRVALDPKDRKLPPRSRFLNPPQKIWFNITVRELLNMDISIDHLITSSKNSGITSQGPQPVRVKCIRIVANYFSCNNSNHQEEIINGRDTHNSLPSLITSNERIIQYDQLKNLTKEKCCNIPRINLVLENSFINSNDDEISENIDENHVQMINHRFIIFEVWATILPHNIVPKKIKKPRSFRKCRSKENDKTALVEKEVLLGTSEQLLFLDTSYLFAQSKQLKRSQVPPIIDHKCLVIKANNQQHCHEIGSIILTLALGPLRCHAQGILDMDQRSRIIQTWWRKRKEKSFESPRQENRDICKEYRNMEKLMDKKKLLKCGTNSSLEKKPMECEQETNYTIMNRYKDDTSKSKRKKYKVDTNINEIQNIDIRVKKCFDEESVSMISDMTSSTIDFQRSIFSSKRKKHNCNLKYILEIQPKGICNNIKQNKEQNRVRYAYDRNLLILS